MGQQLRFELRKLAARDDADGYSLKEFHEAAGDVVWNRRLRGRQGVVEIEGDETWRGPGCKTGGMTHDADVIPTIGYGTYALTDPASSVASAIELGYRLIDTASSYGNEREVGLGVRDSAVARDQVAVTSKLRGDDQVAGARAGLERSLDDLGLSYLDNYLIHWPLPSLGRYREVYGELMAAREEGLIRRLGVSNFLPEHLTALYDAYGEWPAINQIELHPYFPQQTLLAWCQERGIEVQAWSPLGRKTDLLSNETVTTMAHAHGCTPAQLVLAWHLARGCAPIPKTDSTERAAENLAAVSLRLTGREVEALASLERGRIGGDPATHVEM